MLPNSNKLTPHMKFLLTKFNFSRDNPGLNNFEPKGSLKRYQNFTPRNYELKYIKMYVKIKNKEK